ncbi:hypothetical protein K437DRAFT_253565 [Tilletiaria anomala UBC 951]|uniref:Anaphase-promoting complex subunit 4-like WD40 domain-containing protein n=1 Tax=Tilletiaria anomala (strain ATCC 24038 / CBS 436.72 / UBC 951) TaxID=1037660 RepID=A0A066WGL9_TILAU|nr:uncharacterized protein K437DRAFT_253565 [Tilletiaria anomala UBC 951]KDN52931.1 hypothetical protein K437DRAFT_253565 [Tilletiaria anomala UBC 951]
MDFTSPFPHSCPGAIAFSPGSTFFALVVHSSARSEYRDPNAASALLHGTKRRRRNASSDEWSTVIIRASSTLQVVRSWDLDGYITSLEWSEEGRYLLAVSPTYAVSPSPSTSLVPQQSYFGVASAENGSVYVLSLDPSLEANDESDEGQGWVARVDAGFEGISGAQWMRGRSDNIILFATDLRASVYSLSDLKVTIIKYVKLGMSITSSKYPGYFGLIRREACKESISLYCSDERRGYRAILEGTAGKYWQAEQSFNLATNDARGAAWSPDGRHIAVWEGHMEYKLLVYTRCGSHRFTFWIPPNLVEPISSALPTGTSGLPLLAVQSTASARSSTMASSLRKSYSSNSVKTEEDESKSKEKRRAPSQAIPKKRKSDDEETKVSGGGLGIRQVAWSPHSTLLAVGGFDEHIRLLDAASGTEIYSLDLSRTTITGELSHSRAKPTQQQPHQGRRVSDFVFGRLHVWREPHLSWLEETGKRCIVAMENSSSSLPVTIPSMRVDTAVSQPKCGVCWMAWSKAGTLLASRNDNMPTAVFIHAFPPIPNDQPDQTPRPYLVAILLFGSAVRSAVWQNEAPSSLTIACGGEALYTWSLDVSADGKSIQQTAEAIPIPNDHVNAQNLHWSPDGRSLLIADHQSFCCAIAA